MPGRSHSFGLDVVRCTAILLVLACHCGLAFTAWTLLNRPSYLGVLGYYGVELFFVLSGFLIGAILIDLACAKPTMRDWLAFMVRRWFRTLPLYFVWLAILTATWPPGLMHRDWLALWGLVPAYACFMQNFAWAPADWFTVSWSLSIEEWFYFCFSIALLGGARVFGVSRAVFLTVSMFLVVPLALRLAQPAQADWNEYLHKAVVFRLDAIAFGVIAAGLIRTKFMTDRLRTRMLGLGASMIIAQCAGLLPLVAWLGPVTGRALDFDLTDAGFALLLPAIARVSRPAGWLDRPVRLFAAQSYGTYLMHYSLIEWVGFARITTHWSGRASSLFCAALILILPTLSWQFFERPILSLRPDLPRHPGDPEYRSRRLA